MKIQQKTFYIDSKSNKSKKFDIDGAVIIDIAQFDHFSSGRKQRRALQSIVVRELLDVSLKKHFQQSFDSAWSLNKSENGKPFINGKDTPSISISHSGDWYGCTISTATLVGIDVEVIKHRDWESYCTFAFHPEEAQWILAASDRERDIRGLICWCRKEAIVKALGVSLSDFISTIAFSAEGKLIALPKEFGEFLDWQFFTEVYSESLVVAVAWKN